MKTKFIFLSILALLITSCGGAETPKYNSIPNAWIDAPLEGSVFPLGEIDIISHTQHLGGIVAVELSINDQVVRLDPNSNLSEPLVLMNQTWTPTEPGQYKISVRGQTPQGDWSQYAVVNITVIGATFTPTLTPTETSTPTPSLTPSPTITPTLSIIIFTLNSNAFCRKGPATSFADVTAFTAGEQVQVQGQLADGSWLLVFSPSLNATCWISSNTGQPSGGLSGVPVLVAPDTPTPTTLPLPAISKVKKSGNQMDDIPGCAGPNSITISATITGAASATLFYRSGGSGWFSINMSHSGDNWSANIQSMLALDPYDGALEYYIQANNAVGSSSSQVFGGITLNQCKP